jgi:hypothetical protein
VRTDDGHTGKRNDFEAAATHLLPYDPVAKKRLSGIKRGAGIISSVVDMTEDDQARTIARGKPAIDKTGVHLQYRKQQEDNKLPKEQQEAIGLTCDQESQT